MSDADVDADVDDAEVLDDVDSGVDSEVLEARRNALSKKTNVGDGLKFCRTCGQTKPFSEFYKHKAATSKDGLHSKCKVCYKQAEIDRQIKRKAAGGQHLDRVQKFVQGYLPLSELTDDELRGSYILDDNGRKVTTDSLNNKFHPKFTKELTRRLNDYIRSKSPRAVEVIFDIADSDLVEPADRLKAATWLAERVIGKTPDVIIHGVTEAPHEAIFENIESGSRDAYRERRLGIESGNIVEAEVVEMGDDANDGSVSGRTSGFADLSRDGDGDGNVEIGSGDVQGQSDDNSGQAIADQIVDKRQAAKDLKKRMADQKRKRFAARAVGVPLDKGLAAQPWLIDWRVRQDGLLACLVPPPSQTQARLAVIEANDQATDDPQFVATQQANHLAAQARKMQEKAERLKEKI